MTRNRKPCILTVLVHVVQFGGDTVIRLDYKDSRSIHEQIEDGIKNLIERKVFRENDQLPSVRELSVSLTVNPNTVQKAYRNLEAQGYIYSVKGKGSFIASARTAKDPKKVEALYKTLLETAQSLMYLGESPENIEKALKEIKEVFE